MVAPADELPEESNDFQVSVPTEDEIRQRAAAIRQTWSASTRKRRRVNPESPPLTIPIIRVAEIRFANEDN